MDEPGLWALVREAVRGSRRDLTAIPVRSAVVLLAVPMVLEMSMESLFSLADIFYVSRLGSDAVATIGLTEAMMSPIYALAMGLSSAATAMIARRTGEKDGDGASTAAVQVIFAATACAVLLGAAGALASPHLLALMGAAPSVVASGSGYTSVMLGGSVTIFLLFVVNAIFRSAGDAAVAMRSLWLANLLNIVLAPCFIFGLGPFPRMGVEGAAVATTLGRGIGVGYQLVLLIRGRGLLVVARRHVAVSLDVLGQLVRIAIPATLQVLVETASWLALVRILSTYGSVVLAGYTIAMRIAIFALLPPWGLANAAATLVGQNLGAGEPERARRSVQAIARYNMVFLGVIGACFAAFPGPFVRLFTPDAAVAAIAADCLRIVALGFLFFAYGMVTVQAFNGAGDTRTPLYVNVTCFWIFKIPLAWGLAKLAGFGPGGVFFSIAAAYSLQAIVAGLLFRRGAWQRAA